MRLAAPRITPLEESDWSDEARAELGRMADGGRSYNIFRTLARYPKLLKRWMPFANHVLFKSALAPRERELLILRTGWNCQAEYEWAQHVIIGKASGLTEDEIARVPAGPDATGWAPFDAHLLRAADELHTEWRVADATWAALAERYDEKQLIEVPMLVGHYQLVAMTLNTLGVELDPGLEGFPA